jgi:quinol monooxygenase YgiN
VIVLVARYQAKPGQGDTVAEALREMVKLVKQHEPGCQIYQACRSTENPDIFLIYEHYIDQAALEAHRQMPHFLDIIEGRIVPLLAKREREFYALVAR